MQIFTREWFKSKFLHDEIDEFSSQFFTFSYYIFLQMMRINASHCLSMYRLCLLSISKYYSSVFHYLYSNSSDYFQKLCNMVIELLLEESNIQPVSTPVTVCGDIHGQVMIRFWCFMQSKNFIIFNFFHCVVLRSRRIIQNWWSSSQYKLYLYGRFCW